MEVLMGVESVLLDEKKSSTYKFALISSIMDYIIENPNEYPLNGFHNIPITYLAIFSFLQRTTDSAKYHQSTYKLLKPKLERT